MEALRAGRLREDSPVCQVGGETWLPAWQTPNLGAALRKAWAPPPGFAPPPGAVPPPPRPTAPVIAHAVPQLAENRAGGGSASRRVPRAVLLGVLILVAAPKLESLFLGVMTAGPHRAATVDGFLEVTLPPHWVSFPGEPDDQLSVMSEDREAYVVIDKLPRERAPAPSLDALEARASRADFYGLKKLVVRKPRPFAVNGLAGVERELVATFKDGPQFVRSVILPYHHNYYRLRLYAPPGQERRRREELDAITRSLRPG
jgi:hypothetical protein